MALELLPLKWLVIMASPVFWVTLSIAANVDDGWSNLKGITRNRSYVVLYPDSHCVRGRLLSVDDGALQLQVGPLAGSSQTLVIQRPQVLRVSEAFPGSPHDAVFSGRSAWSDVKAAAPVLSEYLFVITKQGKKSRWTKPAVSNDSIAAGRRTVLKSDIRFVSYVRFKPVSDSEAYNWREAGIYAWPFFWLRQHTMAKISVLFYDSEAQQDDSPIACNPDP